MPRASTRSGKRKRNTDDMDDIASEADMMFGPAGAELPVLSNLTYNVTQNHSADTEVPSLNGTQLKLSVSLAGTDIIAGLKALYRSGDVRKPYPKHVQRLASLGRSEVTVRVNCSGDNSSEE